MCRAIYEIKKDARREGKREGRREGKLEGRCESIFELLEDCGEIPEEIRRKITMEKNTEQLRVWHKLAARVQTIEEFCEVCQLCREY